MVHSQNHAHYQASLLARLRQLCATLAEATRLWGLQKAAMTLWCADLDCIAPILGRCYTGSGRPPRDPLAMFRTWLLATLLKVTSPKAWAQRLRTDPLLAILSGFEPGDTPGASTLRDFMSRLTRQMRRRGRRHRPHTKRGKAPGKGKKRPLRRPDVLWRLAAQLPRFSHGDEGTLQQMLVAIAHESAHRGLIDLAHLSVAGDSTILASHTNSFGHHTCSCPPGTRCAHLRIFTDPDANWGWDSSRGIWVWGHRFYEITAAGLRYDLPLHIGAVSADRHDAVSWLIAYTEARSCYAEAHWLRAVLDSAHDAAAIFDQLQRDRVQAVVDLNPAHNPKQPVTLGADGIPICDCGQPMAPDGSARGRIKFVCPRKRKHRNPASEPACTRTVYVSGDAAFRLHPGLARSTDAWRLAYNTRTCTERSHSRKRNAFGQTACRRRGRPARTAHYFFAAFAQHFTAWAAEASLHIEAAFRDILAPYMTHLLTLPRTLAA